MRIELEKPNQAPKPSSSDSFIPPKDEKRTIKSEIAKMKEMGFKDGWNYYWDYYKVPTFVVILCIIFVVSITHTVIRNMRPHLIQVYIYNNYIPDDVDTNDFCEAYAEHMDANLDDYQMVFNATDIFDLQNPSEQMQATLYKLAAMVAASDLDIIGGDRSFIDYYGCMGYDEVYFDDLSKILPSDLFAQLETQGRIYYCNYYDEEGNKLEAYPAAIDITNSRLTSEAGLLITPSYIGVMCNTSRLENAIEFIKWIFYLD